MKIQQLLPICALAFMAGASPGHTQGGIGTIPCGRGPIISAPVLHIVFLPGFTPAQQTQCVSDITTITTQIWPSYLAEYSTRGATPGAGSVESVQTITDKPPSNPVTADAIAWAQEINGKPPSINELLGIKSGSFSDTWVFIIKAPSIEGGTDWGEHGILGRWRRGNYILVAWQNEQDFTWSVSHELFENQTDPCFNAWINYPNGKLEELADRCDTLGLGHVVDGVQVTYVWSNKAGACQ